MESPLVSRLSNKTIAPRARLIVAADVPTAEDAQKLVTELGDSVTFYKLGLQLYSQGHMGKPGKAED